ncbi:MAG TPA: rhomboid family intramembrane serine protease [Polyangiaceae bacterium]|nr:rhomboid family intramembrane serine protease [Polyangiaceae bacterium]
MLPLRDQLPTRRPPVVTYALIALNVVAYLVERTAVAEHGTRVVMALGLVPARLLADPLAQAHTVATSMFMHAPETWWHLGSNMLFLWIFGDNVEDALGKGRYMALYLLAGLFAAVAQIAIDPSSAIPIVGASGAISGVLAAYGTLYPRSPVLVLNPIMPMWLFGYPTLLLPAWLIIAEYFIMNLLGGFASVGASGGGVAFFAHLGGFVSGLVLVRLLYREPPRPHDPWSGWRPPPRPRGGPPSRDRGRDVSGRPLRW